jgi:hypothetical protein
MNTTQIANYLDGPYEGERLVDAITREKGPPNICYHPCLARTLAKNCSGALRRPVRAILFVYELLQQ